MGKLVQLVGSGIGLAVEASSSRTASPRGDQNSNRAQSPKSSLSRDVDYDDADEYGSRRGPPSYADSQANDMPRRSPDYRTSSSKSSYSRSLSRGEADSYCHEYPHQVVPYGPSQGYAPAGPAYPPSQGVIIQTPTYPPSQWSTPAEPTYPPHSCRLPLPVIIPQRRPGSNGRGWVLGYAPVLGECGIDQPTFLRFIDSFNKASKASPVLDVVNIAALGVGFAPGIAPIIVSSLVPIAVKYAKAAQTKSQTQSYLGRMNNELFAPRGLFAMIMTFKPDEQSQILPIDTSSSSAMVMPGARSSGFDRRHVNSRTSYGEAQLPASAPLVIPAPGELSEEPRDKLNGMGHFVADYYDRRSQARYAQQNPGSALSADYQPSFKSRWGDPTHPMNNGKLSSLLTGGLIDRQRRGSSSSSSGDDDDRKRRRGRKCKKDKKDKNSKRNKSPGLIGSVKGAIAGPGNEDQGLIKGMKGKLMNSDVLYLMIVNKPTESQMVEAEQQFAREDGR